MTATDLLRRMESVGYTLVLVTGGKVRVRPASRLDNATIDAIKEHKAELVNLLRERLQRDACPTCRRALDERRACWKCCDRLCETCGRQTGSAFIALCLSCDMAARRAS
jgi:hypothetical protein